MAKTVYFANKVLDHFWGGGGIVPSASVFLALYVGGAPGVGAEVAVAGYARKTIVNDGSVLGTTPANGTLVNVGAIVFDPAPTVPYGTISHAGIFDALTGGNLLEHGPLATPVVVGIGDSIAFGIGSLTFSEA